MSCVLLICMTLFLDFWFQMLRKCPATKEPRLIVLYIPETILSAEKSFKQKAEKMDREYFNVNLHYTHWALKASGWMGSADEWWEIAFGQEPDHLRDGRQRESYGGINGRARGIKRGIDCQVNPFIYTDSLKNQSCETPDFRYHSLAECVQVQDCTATWMFLTGNNTHSEDYSDERCSQPNSPLLMFNKKSWNTESDHQDGSLGEYSPENLSSEYLPPVGLTGDPWNFE